jgi:hypothetical protein
MKTGIEMDKAVPQAGAVCDFLCLEQDSPYPTTDFPQPRNRSLNSENGFRSPKNHFRNPAKDHLGHGKKFVAQEIYQLS